MSSRRRAGLSLAAVMGLAVIGCAGTGPKLFPSSPMVSDPLPDGSFDRWYDTDGDGWSDYCERLSPAGRIVRLSYSAGRHRPAEHIELDQIPADQQLHLVLLLDSISYSVALEAWQGGRFRYCARPSRTIGPFPVMSDLSFSELFGCSPSPGVESCYFDGKHLTNGYGTYASDSNVNWAKYVDYRLDAIAHAPSHDATGYRYRPEYGDPLDLLPTLEKLQKEGHVDAAGFVDDRILFDATMAATYPDAVQRLWTAFHGLIQHTPDVIVSIEEGYYAGSPMMSSMVRMLGVHGNLKLAGTSAFAMTSAGDLPAVLRIKDLRAALARLGVSLPGRVPVSQPASAPGEPPS